jgi:hypothetical protein
MKYYKNSNGDYFSYNYEPQFAESADMTEITKAAYNKGVAAIAKKIEEEEANAPKDEVYAPVVYDEISEVLNEA